MLNKVLIAIIGVIALTLAVIAYLQMPAVEVSAPVDQSALRRDHQRLAHITQIKERIEWYWDKHHKLPATVGQLIDGKEYKVNPKDPRHSVDYEYNVINKQNFQLCAIFSIPTPPSEQTQFWRHPNDHHCFEFHIGQKLEPTPTTER